MQSEIIPVRYLSASIFLMESPPKVALGCALIMGSVSLVWSSAKSAVSLRSIIPTPYVKCSIDFIYRVWFILPCWRHRSTVERMLSRMWRRPQRAVRSLQSPVCLCCWCNRYNHHRGAYSNPHSDYHRGTHHHRLTYHWRAYHHHRLHWNKR